MKSSQNLIKLCLW